MTWLSYRTAIGCLGPTLVLSAVVLAPFAALLNLSTALTVGDGGVIANGRLEAATSPGRFWLVWWLGLALVGGLAGTFVIASGVVVAAGALIDRPAAPRAAARFVWRRRPLLVALTIGGFAVVATILAIGILLLRMDTSPWLGPAAMVLAALIALPYALVLPAAILEGRSGWRAIGRAYRVAEFRRIRFTAALVLAAIVPAAVATPLPELVASPLDGLWRTLVIQTLRDVLLVIVVPFQAAAVAVVFLNRSDVLGAWRPVTTRDADRDLVRRGLTELASHQPERPTDERRRRIRVLTPALVLPGLVFTAYVWLNPLGLPTFSDRDVPLADDEYRGEPASLHYDGDGRLLALVQGYSAGALVTCDDVACSHAAERYDNVPFTTSPQTDTATLPDGRLAIASWEPSDDSDDERWELRLRACSDQGCDTGASQFAPTLRASGTSGDFQLGASIASRPDGGVVVAHIAHSDDDNEERADEPPALLALTTCADLRCTERRTVELTRLPSGLHPEHGQPLSVAVGPDGTPAVAYRDEYGRVTVSACDTSQCRRPEVTTPVEGTDDPLTTEDAINHPNAGLDVVVGRGGLPVVAYREADSGTARLLSCQDRTCSQVVDRAVTGPGWLRPGPALMQGDEGRLFVATYDEGGRQGRLVLVVCDDPACTVPETVPLANVRHKAGRPEIAFTPDGRPQVLWADYDDFLHRGHLRLTTCASPDCR